METCNFPEGEKALNRFSKFQNSRGRIRHGPGVREAVPGGGQEVDGLQRGQGTRL